MAELPFPDDPPSAEPDAPNPASAPGLQLILAQDARAAEEWLLGQLNVYREDLRADPALLGAAPLTVVVPNARFRVQLLARLGAHGAWAGLEVLPLDALAHRCLDRNQALPVADAQLLLEYFVRRGAEQLPGLSAVLADLNDGFDAVLPAVQDLIQAGLRSEAAEAWSQEQFQVFLERRELSIDEPRAESWFKETAEGRAAELALLAGRWREFAEANHLDRNVRLARAAECAKRTADPRGRTVAPRGRTVAFGFLRPTALELDLLEALLAGDSDALVVPARAEPEVWQGRLLRAERVPLTGPSAPAFQALKLSGPTEERDAVVDFLREHLHGGALPEQLALIVEPANAVAWARHLERYGVPCSSPAVPGALEPHGRWALAFAQTIAQGARIPIARLFEVLHPEFFHGLVPDQDRATRSDLNLWRAQLERLGVARLEDLRTESGGASADEANRADNRGSRAPEVSAALVRLVPALEASRTEGLDLGERVAAALEWLDQLGWPREDAARAFLAGVLQALLSDPGSAVQLTAREFAQALEGAIDRRGRASLGGRGAGVQLLRPTDATGLSWRALAWPGLSRGTWPRDTADDPLLPDRLRGGGLWAGLRTAREERALAREIFDQLRHSAESTWFSYAEFDADGKEQAPAPLLTRARGGAPFCELAAVGSRPPEWHARWAAGVEGNQRRELLALALPAELAASRARSLDELDAPPSKAERDGLGPFLGLVGPAELAAEGQLFITRLEGYARCGWQALLEKEARLKRSLDPLADALELAPSAIGLVVHEVLERSARLAAGERFGTAQSSSRPEPIELEPLLERDPVDWPRPSTQDLEPLLHSAARSVARTERLAGRFAGELLAERARPMLAEALEVLWATGEPRRILGVEVAARLPLEPGRGPTELRFFADLVELDPESESPGLHLVDYKTGAPISKGARAKTREQHLQAKLTSGVALQAAVYALASGGRGSYAYLKDGLDMPAEARFQGLDASQAREAFEEVVEQLLGERQVGVYPPRLLDEGETAEPRACAMCDVALACRRHDSGARLRIEHWLESVRDHPPEDVAQATWLGYWNRGSKPSLRGEQA